LRGEAKEGEGPSPQIIWPRTAPAAPGMPTAASPFTAGLQIVSLADQEGVRIVRAPRRSPGIYSRLLLTSSALIEHGVVTANNARNVIAMQI